MLAAAEHVHVQPAPPRLQPLVLCAIRRGVPANASVAGSIHANAYACLNVVLEGTAGLAGGAALPARFITGPFTRPLATSVRGPLRSVSVVLQPWLLPALAGLAPRTLVDGLQDLDRAGRPARSLADAAAAPDGPAWWDAFEASLPAGVPAAAWELALDVLRNEGLQAALAATGVGERHYRRLFTARLGLPPRTWLRLQRFDAMAQRLAASGSLGQLAAEAGYADQAHLTREAQAVAGHSPARLREALVQRAPGLWSLRPAEVRFVQDGRTRAA